MSTPNPTPRAEGEKPPQEQSLSITTDATAGPCIIVTSPESPLGDDGPPEHQDTLNPGLVPGVVKSFPWEALMPDATEQQRRHHGFRLTVIMERGGMESFVVRKVDGLKNLVIKAKQKRGPLGGTMITVEPNLDYPQCVFPLEEAIHFDLVEAFNRQKLLDLLSAVAAAELRKPKPVCSSDKPPIFCGYLEAWKKKKSERLPFLGELFIVNKESVPLALYIRNPMTDEDLLVTPYLPPDGGVVRTSWTALKNAPLLEYTLKALDGTQRFHDFTMKRWDPISTVTIGGTKEWPPKISVGGDYKLASGRIVRKSWEMIRDATEAAKIWHSTEINATLRQRLDESTTFLRDPEGRVPYHEGEAIAALARTQLEIVNNGSHDTFVVLVSRKTGRKLLSVDVAAKQIFRTSWSVLGAGELVEGDPLDLKVSNGKGMPWALYEFKHDQRTHTLLLDQKPGDTRIEVQAFPSNATFSRYADNVQLYEKEIDDLSKRRLKMHFESVRLPILPYPSFAPPPEPRSILSDDKMFPGQLPPDSKKLLIQNEIVDFTIIVTDLASKKTSPSIDLKKNQALKTSWTRFINDQEPGLQGLRGRPLLLTIRLAAGETKSFPVTPCAGLHLLVFELREGELVCSSRSGSSDSPSSESLLPPLEVEDAGHRETLLKHRAGRYLGDAYRLASSQPNDEGYLPHYEIEQFIPPVYPCYGLQPQPRRVEDKTGGGSLGMMVEQKRDSSALGVDYVTINHWAGTPTSFVLQAGAKGLSGDNLYEWPHRVRFRRPALFDDEGRGEDVTLTVRTRKAKASTYHFRASNDLDEIRIGAQNSTENPTVELHFFKWKPGLKREPVSPSERLQLQQKANLRRADKADQSHLAWLTKLENSGRLPPGPISFIPCTDRRAEEEASPATCIAGGPVARVRVHRNKNRIAAITNKDLAKWRRQQKGRNKSLSATITGPREQTPTAVNKAKDSQNRRQRRFAGGSSTPSAPARSRNTEDWRSFPMHLLNDSVLPEEALSKTLRESGTSRSGSTNAATSNNTGLLPLYASASLLQAVIDGFLPQPQLLR